MPFMINLLNPPVAQPGIYRIWKLDDDKSYVGQATKRISGRYRGWQDSHGRTSKLKTAIREYGLESFAFEPLYLLIGEVDRAHLNEAETALIIEFDSVENGYNIRYQIAGPQTEQFKELIRRSWRDPKVRANHHAGRTTPAARDRARKTLDKTGTIWITDGTTQHRISKADPIPDGWRKGRGPKGSEIARLGGLGGGWKTRRTRYGKSGGAKSPNKATRRKLGIASRLAQANPETKEKHREAINESWVRRRERYGSNGRRPQAP